MSHWIRRQRVSSDLDAALAASYRHAVHTHENATGEQIRRELDKLHELNVLPGPPAGREPGKPRAVVDWILDAGACLLGAVFSWPPFARRALKGVTLLSAVLVGAAIRSRLMFEVTVIFLTVVLVVVLPVVVISAAIRLAGEATRSAADRSRQASGTRETGRARRSAGRSAWRHAHGWAGSPSCPSDDA